MNPLPLFLIIVSLPLLLGGCGEKEAVSVDPNLTYLTEGDAITITDCDRKASGALIIPATVERKSVTKIVAWTFTNCSNLTSITIPDSVTSIGDGAFENCKNLAEVTFLGDAPKVGAGVLLASTPIIYRKPEAKGWGDTFAGRPVKLISEKP